MGAYDPETVNVLRDALDQAWALLPNERKAVTLKADMADRILKCAAEGERDPVRLRMAELLQRAAEVLRKARATPIGAERNELRQIAIGLRWMATRKIETEQLGTAEAE